MSRFQTLFRTRYLLLWSLLVLLAAGFSLNRPVQGDLGGSTSPSHDPSSHSHGDDAAQVVVRPPLSDIPCDPATGMAGIYPCRNVDLLAFVPTNAVVGGTGSDIWGWTDPETGIEYAIQSHSTAVSFVDISDPTNPVLVGTLPAPVPNVLWRDVKVYNNHAYIVGDGNFVVTHGLQIFDLTGLRAVTNPPVVFQQTARDTGFGRAHNIAINEATGRAFVVGSTTCAGGLRILDLQDPTSPDFLGCFSADGYTHDAQCVIYNGPDAAHQGREVCFNANEDTLTIVDVQNPAAPVQLARAPYPGSSYTHQGWLTEDHAYFVLGDETDEQSFGHNTHSYIWDVRDLDAPVLISTHAGRTTAIDHNLFIRDGYIFEANYTAGLQIYDAVDIADGILTEVAYFDTHPASDVAEFAGAWSSYAFFESGVVVVSNIEDGLYILRPHLERDGGEAPDSAAKATGGGWLAATDGKKINYGFNAKQEAAGFSGELQLNDKGTGARIHLTDVTALSAVNGDCGGIGAGSNALEFSGMGTFNGSTATFRVCVEDNGEPGKDSDRFVLSCTAGCSYSTSDRTADALIDGGNLQVHQPEGGSSAGGAAASGQASTLVLNPLLLNEGVIGQLQPFAVQAYDADQNPLSGAEITLVRVTAGGTESFTAVTDLAGQALFTLVNLSQASETIAVSGSVQSNAVAVQPLLP